MAAVADKKKAEPKSFVRRDTLREIEIRCQKKWADEKTFESDAPAPGEVDEYNGKYFTTFPYPYMNGLLHLGHTFSLSKMEFAVGYERLKGKRTLWPFAFHCTGMPIQAAANKLARELELYGNPPVFPVVEEPVEAAPVVAVQKAADAKFTSKKGKVAAKKGAATQWGILIEMGIPPEEIPKFVDPVYWLRYFPPIAVDHLKQMGVKVDWRRSFITTSVNKYYDSFIRWQFNKLRSLNKLNFGKRFSIYSPLDKQLCADHDRACGEGVLPQEYTLILLDLVSPLPEKLKHLEGQRVALAAATLRPETMYGQTNCWILPDGVYGAYAMAGGGYVVCSERAAKNMSFQDLTPKFGEIDCQATVTGWDLLGAACKAPLAQFDKVYVLPMLTISLGKGTGIVTSVPSDAPDDYMALMDLVRKAPMREKFKLTDDMVIPFTPVPIINIPGMGDQAAVTICEEMKIQSQNDKVKLAEAKDKVYLKGFYEGTMIVGGEGVKGAKVADAKPIVRQLLLDSKQALAYAEPEKYVESRSGDECVVALTDQWYITYGEPEWRQAVEKHLKENVETYSDDTRKLFEGTLSWLKEWGCSRSFGLGTLLPWDEQYVIESLSDSTIYMAFYTVVHFLQGGVIDGSSVGPSGINPEKINDELWEYLLLEGPMPQGVADEATLAKMRNEFQYWYPVDLRVSGKDLIQNHLTFFMYNHAAIFPQRQWPRAIRTNGHVMLNNAKMSKSTGNFLTLVGAIERFGADAMRLALAQAGDSNEDANFEIEVADSAILRLTTELKWIEDMLALQAKGALRTGDKTLLDNLFGNEISRCVLACESGYARHNFRDAVTAGFFSLQLARDSYRAGCGAPENAHSEVVMRFIETQMLLLSPFCPHIAQHVWELLGKGDIMKARWPEAPPVDANLSRINQYMESVLHEFRKKRLDADAKALKAGKGKGKEAAAPPPAISTATVVIAADFMDYQRAVLEFMASQVTEGGMPADIKQRLMAEPNIKPHAKLAMPFSKFVEDDFKARGRDALELSLPFDEQEFLKSIEAYLMQELKVTTLVLLKTTDADAAPFLDRVKSATPGKPCILFS